MTQLSDQSYRLIRLRRAPLQSTFRTFRQHSRERSLSRTARFRDQPGIEPNGQNLKTIRSPEQQRKSLVLQEGFAVTPLRLRLSSWFDGGDQGAFLPLRELFQPALRFAGKRIEEPRPVAEDQQAVFRVTRRKFIQRQRGRKRPLLADARIALEVKALDADFSSRKPPRQFIADASLFVLQTGAIYQQ